MAFKVADLSDDDVIYAFLGEYLDGEVAPDVKARVSELLRARRLEDLPARFGDALGHFQVGLAAYGLSELELQDIHRLVQSDAERASHENHDIDRLGRTEFFGNMARRLLLLAALVGAIFAVVYFATPPKKPSFSALDTIPYEAMQMIEDPDGRLDFPSNSIREIQDFFDRDKNLGFTSRPLKVLEDSQWAPDGASVIDYDVAKLAVVQYENKARQEKAFLFQYAGNVNQLTASEPGNYKGLLYQAYSTERLNIVVWQASEESVAMMVGTRSAPELAEMAYNITGP